MHTGIIDVSHWESDDVHGAIAPALAKAAASGVTAVIAKATQGKDYTDPSFAAWVAAVRAQNLLFGAYHFGSNTTSGDRQADWFLAALARAGVSLATTRLALDFERNPDPSHTMTLDQAHAFAARIVALTGRAPLLYGDTSFLSQIHSPHDPLAACPLWPAAFGNGPPRIPPAWEGYTLWQYTDGRYGPSDRAKYPRLTPGFGAIDRSVWQGTAEALAAWWGAR